MPSFALDAIWLLNLVLLHGRQSPDCDRVDYKLQKGTCTNHMDKYVTAVY